MATNLGRHSGVRRWVSPLPIFAGILIGLVAVSRATDPQDGQKVQAEAPPPPGEVEIRNLLKAVTNAYNQADAKGLADQFTDDAALFGQDGEEVRGRDAIGRHYAEAFAKGPTCKRGKGRGCPLSLPRRRLCRGRFRARRRKGTALSSGRYSLITVRKEGDWRLAELRDIANTISETPEREESLRDLEWLVGEWVDEGEDGKVASHGALGRG